MAKIELLCGPIASGKSTYCRIAANEGAIIINDDSIVTAIHGGNYSLYNESLKPLYKSIENTAISTALTLGLRVVVDRPNYSVAMRRRYIGIAKSFDVPVKVVMFERVDPVVHGRRRAASDSRGHSEIYWIDVAKHHDSLFETPDPVAEGFDEWICWMWSGSC